MLTQHDFIGGDDAIELEGVGDDPALVPVVELVLMDEPPAVSTAVVHHHVEVTPRPKLPLPVGNGGEWGDHQERPTDAGTLWEVV